MENNKKLIEDSKKEFLERCSDCFVDDFDSEGAMALKQEDVDYVFTFLSTLAENCAIHSVMLIEPQWFAGHGGEIELYFRSDVMVFSVDVKKGSSFVFAGFNEGERYRIKGKIDDESKALQTVEFALKMMQS